MKKSLLLISFCFLMASGLFAQDVVQEQRTLLTKITATWCPNCGAWAWDFFEEILEDNHGKAVFVGSHHSGDLESSPGIAFSSNFNAPYQPYFYAGNENLNVSSGNMPTKRQQVQDLVNANFEEMPIANTGFSAILDGNILTIDAKAKFFQEASGDFYMGVYLLENGVINNQASNSNMASHPFVLRQAITPGNFGISLGNGTIAADTEFTEALSLQINSTYNTDSIYIMGIIWEKIDDTYQFVNAFTTNEFAAPASVETITSDVLAVALAPTIAQESSQLSLNLKQSSLAVNIQVINVNGQIVQEVFEGDLLSGASNFTINTNALNTGIYFVNIRSNDGAVLTKRLVVR